MKIQQAVITGKTDNPAQELSVLQNLQPQWVLVFGSAQFFSDSSVVAALIACFPEAVIMGCSTAGEIGGTTVLDNHCVVTAVRFDTVHLRPAQTLMEGMDDSYAAGSRIGEQLRSPALKAVMVLGPGVQINGTALVDGISGQIGEGIPITGGLAGDGGAFQKTWILSSSGAIDRGVIAVGFEGDGLSFAHGSFGGWQPFGPERRVTRCDGNVLYELDGEPALDVYKRYLGDYVAKLPSSGLLFPFAMLGEDHNAIGLIRTILSIDETQGSLTLAGTIDPNGYLKLMHASTDRLVDGAEEAADAAKAMYHCAGDSLAVLVSCVGRKLVMGDRVDEEVEAVASVFGSKATLTGFYSYGEISPFSPGVACKLHNQTMTITWLGEV